MRHPSGYAWHRLADDLLALLDHVGPREKAHGVGPSMGTGTLLHAAVRAPGHFASLTLVVPPHRLGDPPRAGPSTYRANADLVEREGLAALVAQAGFRRPPLACSRPPPPPHPSVAEDLLPTVLRGAAAHGPPCAPGPLGRRRAHADPRVDRRPHPPP